jgi:hypothetical protein
MKARQQLKEWRIDEIKQLEFEVRAHAMDRALKSAKASCAMCPIVCNLHYHPAAGLSLVVPPGNRSRCGGTHGSRTTIGPRRRCEWHNVVVGA